MITNTKSERKHFASRLTHIMQIQTQYGRLWLRSRFRRMTVPASVKLFLLALLGLSALVITGTLLLIFDAIALMSHILKRPFYRGNLRQRCLMRKPV
ncbi:hypothetical protein J1781_25665 [Rahnella sp. C60]|uniref:hypothetical protein n=1 Tax=Rahnella perminowiae TaxID=2816244 RepID=UPI001C27F1D3|nr:hypothetical protein [Rahnella perminowiae]MBU9818220.1 hypothetical protein [Rahnella perminowiae]